MSFAIAYPYENSLIAPRILFLPQPNYPHKPSLSSHTGYKSCLPSSLHHHQRIVSAQYVRRTSGGTPLFSGGINSAHTLLSLHFQRLQHLEEQRSSRREEHWARTTGLRYILQNKSDFFEGFTGKIRWFWGRERSRLIHDLHIEEKNVIYFRTTDKIDLK